MSETLQNASAAQRWQPTLQGLSIRHPLIWLISGSTLILFICSSLRHWLLSSTAFDLGIFDQAIYLISQGEPPISSYRDFHILGDHAAWIFYPIALLYRIYPDVHWLFLIQALALPLATVPMWGLARQAGLSRSLTLSVAIAYLLYPLVFNVNLFDFHPEVIAPAALLAAVWAARSNQIFWFIVAIVVILSLKAVLALTVAAMGFWLWLFEKKRWCGAIALFAGVAWFLIAVQWVIPVFSGAEAAAVSRYDELGDSPLAIARNLLFQPSLLLNKVFTLANLVYLCLLVIPLLWGLSFTTLAPMIGAVPTIALNVLTDYTGQKDLIHQYSLPALPFLILTVIATLAAGKGLLHSRRWIVLWSLVAFLALAKYGKVIGYFQNLESWRATREAIALIQTQEGVLTDNQLAPQVNHRPVVELLKARSLPADLATVKYVLLNLDRPWSSTAKLSRRVARQLQKNPQFQLRYRQDQVFLFVKESNASQP
jgi:uncharacterized membrane protein